MRQCSKFKVNPSTMRKPVESPRTNVVALALAMQ